MLEMELGNNHLSELLHVIRTCDGMIQKPKATDLNIAHWNINRLFNKIHEVEAYIDTFPGVLHVIIIAETWLTSLTAPRANLNGYRSVHNFRESSGGGGISIFVHRSLCPESPIDVRTSKITDDLNHFVTIRIAKLNLNISATYRRPRSNTTLFLQQLEEFSLCHDNCILFGDFNLNLLEGAKHKTVTDCLEPNGFALLNVAEAAFPTRLASGTVLDLAATNMTQFRYLMSIVHQQISDHSVIFVSLNKRVEVTTTTMTRPKLNLHEAVVRTVALTEGNTYSCGRLYL